MQQFNWSLEHRLKELKKLSIQLKNQVEAEPNQQNQTISSILTLIIPQPHQHAHLNTHSNTQSTTHHHQNTENSQKKVMMESSSTKSIKNWGTNNSVKDKYQDMNDKSSASYFKPYYSQHYYEQEITKIQQNNIHISSQLSKLSQQLYSLRQAQALKEDEFWKQSLPFVAVECSVNVFITKLYIKEGEVQKIDFQIQKVQMINDKIKVHTGDKSMRIFHLINLTDVKYYKQANMRCQFTEKEILYLYCSFNNQQDRQQWDYALFINHKIAIITKDIDKTLFAEEKEILTQRKSKIQVRVSEEQSLKKSQDRQKMKTFKSSFKKSSKSSIHISNLSENLKKTDSQKVQNQYTLNGAYHEANFSGVQITSSHVSFSSNKSKDLKQLTVFQDMPRQNLKESRANTSRFNHNETLNYQNLRENDFYDQLHNNTSKQSQKISIIQSDDNRNLLALKQGYFFKKYSKDGFRPRNKKVFIIGEEMLICADSDKLSERKAIPIENIKSLRYPAIGEGIRKHLENAKVENFCVIHYHIKGIEKTLQLGCNRITFIKRFSKQLYEFLHNKGLLIND